MRYYNTQFPYLLLRDSGYYFRYVIPVRLRDFLKQRELKYSLRTHNKKTAKHRAARLAALLHEVFETVDSRELTPQRIKGLIHKELTRWLRDYKEMELDFPVSTQEDTEKLARTHEHMAQQYRLAIGTRDFGIVQDEALSLLSEQKVDVSSSLLSSLGKPPKGSEDILRLYRRVARELADAKAFFFDAMADRNRGITGNQMTAGPLGMLNCIQK
jgi:hypothetical protein